MKYINFANRINHKDQPEILLTMIDLSGSMESDDIKPSRMAAAIKANQEIINVKEQHHSDDSVGVIGFQRSAKFLEKPKPVDQINNLERNINESGLIPGTDFTAPLELAYEYFSGKPKNALKKSFSKMISNILFEPTDPPFEKSADVDALKRIILLTDGEHIAASDPNDFADKLKKMGVIIDCIGIGGTPADVDEYLLKNIASRNPDGSVRYCFIGDQYKLLQKYRSLARHIQAI